MIYRGIVKNGVVLILEDAQLPEGTEVRVEPCEPHVTNACGDVPTVAEQFADVIGTVPDLPRDMADQHDHYLHGAPKR